MADDVNMQVRWFDHQFVRAEDLQAEQAFHNERRHRHLTGFHTPGIVKGLDVTSAGTNVVNVAAGFAVGGNGQEMLLLNGAANVQLAANETLWLVPQRVQKDPSTDPGTEGENRRWDETPQLVHQATAQARPSGAVELARNDAGTLSTAHREMAGLEGRDTILSKDITEWDGSPATDSENGAGIKTPHLADGVVTDAKLQSDTAGDNTKRAVGTNHIKDAAVTGDKLQSSTTTDAQRPVGTNNIKDAAVTDTKLQSHASDNAQRAVGMNHIKDGAISPAKLQTGVYFPVTIPPNSIDSTHIVDNSVTANDLRADTTTDSNRAVTTNHIRDRAVTAAKLSATSDNTHDADRAVTTDAIRNNAVTDAKLQSDGAGDNTKRAVGTNHIKDGAVTETKLQSSTTTDTSRAVGTNHIKDGAVTETKIGGLAVTNGKIGAGAVTDGKLASSTSADSGRAVGENHIKTGAVTETKIGTNAVTNAKIFDNAVTTSKIAADNVTNAKIARSTIASGSVTIGWGGGSQRVPLSGWPVFASLSVDGGRRATLGFEIEGGTFYAVFGAGFFFGGPDTVVRFTFQGIG